MYVTLLELISESTVALANGVAVINIDLSPFRSATRRIWDALNFKEYPSQHL